MGRAPHSLRLVNGSADNINTKIVSFDQATERADEARGLRAEARDFEARNGKNPYSDFLLKHGSRPDRSHAATLGHMINIRVRADDGTLQPKLTAAQRASAKIFHSQRKIELARREQISKLICAIRDLAEITEKSENILTQLSPHFDRPIIIKDLNVAVEYLNRFASEWHLHEKGNDGTS